MTPSCNMFDSFFNFSRCLQYNTWKTKVIDDFNSEYLESGLKEKPNNCETSKIALTQWTFDVLTIIGLKKERYNKCL